MKNIGGVNNHGREANIIQAGGLLGIVKIFQLKQRAKYLFQAHLQPLHKNIVQFKVKKIHQENFQLSQILDKFKAHMTGSCIQ